MAEKAEFPLFVVAEEDPLAEAHAAVLAWVQEGMTIEYKYSLKLKDFPSGRSLIARTPDECRRFVQAAVAQGLFYQRLLAQIKQNLQTDFRLLPRHHEQIEGLVRMFEVVIDGLTRRQLPLDKTDLLKLLAFFSERESHFLFCSPLSQVTQALKHYFADHPVDEELCEAMRQLASHLRASSRTSVKRACTALGQLCALGQATDGAEESKPLLPPPQPALCGSPAILTRLKRLLHMLPDEEETVAVELQEADQFPLREDSPLKAEHKLLSQFYLESIAQDRVYDPDLSLLATGREILQRTPTAVGKVVLAAAERYLHSLLPTSEDLERGQFTFTWSFTQGALAKFLEMDFQLDRFDGFEYLLFLGMLPSCAGRYGITKTFEGIETLPQAAEEAPLSEGERFVLSFYRASLMVSPLLGTPAEEIMVLTRLIRDGANFYLVPGEIWSDALNRELSQLEEPEQALWTDLLKQAMSANSARPSAKWIKTTEKLLEQLGPDQVAAALLHWFPLVNEGRTTPKVGSYAEDTRRANETIHPENAIALRGLLWCVPLLPQQAEFTRVVTAVALSAYKKVPGIGPRAVKVGNAAVYALSAIGTQEAVGQLAMLKVRIKFGTAQKEIEKAFDAAATALGLPRDQIEELGVPSYGLEEVGLAHAQFGTYRAELRVTGSQAELKWFDPKDKPLKSVPAKVKSEFKDDLKELQQSLKDIQAMLPAQRDRIDSLFLLQKSWAIAEWRDRYLTHPLVGTIAERLIWCVDETPVLFEAGIPTDVQGQPVEHGQTSEITLWHPVGRSIDEIIAWRRRLEELEITQPFKQAYREVYLLTDAERNTHTYSNRYAAHIVRQHQFNALCAARGWKNQLRLMVDDIYPPATKVLPQWGLRAEFWVEGIGQDYGVDTNEAGTFLRLATDQVRFYRLEAAANYVHAGGGHYTSRAHGPGDNDINTPLPLEEIPPLVFSEIMRDVDLFVGVASVGNDPTWQDGGPEGRYLDYWNNYSFGELSGTATTRKQVLERLVPRLKIASRCAFNERFLVVRGDLRTYKIHLGSGNILMEPNDQYLCIVPDARARASQSDLYLPFEGDATLSIIISKAFLLAEDTKIKDTTITRQIQI